MGKVRYIFIFIFIIFITGCNKKSTEIKIAVNEWIGYAPLFYANEKGWLKNSGIKLIYTKSLGESLSLYKNRLVNALASTQYEYLQISNQVKPIILLDQSYGGDMILSNRSVKELKKLQNITTYLEIDSVNFLLLKYFLKEHNISMGTINLISSNQDQLTKMVSNINLPIMIVTYAPYDVTFKKLGFNMVASTKTDEKLLIIDAIFVDKKYPNKRFIDLKQIVDKAITDIKLNPKFVFNMIKKYYPNYSYEDFVSGLNNIKWINKNNPNILKKIKTINLPTNYLIK